MQWQLQWLPLLSSLKAWKEVKRVTRTLYHLVISRATGAATFAGTAAPGLVGFVIWLKNQGHTTALEVPRDRGGRGMARLASPVTSWPEWHRVVEWLGWKGP